MIQILHHLQKYIPRVEYEEVFIPSTATTVSKVRLKQHRIVFGGDQLTVARTRGAQVAMANAHALKERIDGFFPTVQDWHTEVVLIKVRMCSKYSICIPFWFLFYPTSCEHIQMYIPYHAKPFS